MNCVDDIRLEQFLQLKKEIRGSDKHLIVGIDAAKEKHNAFFGTARGKTLVKIWKAFKSCSRMSSESKFSTACRRSSSASSRQRTTTSPCRST